MYVASVPHPAPAVLLGGKYVLGDCIGAGGMGRVYRAEQPSLARVVAIKLLHRVLADDPRIARHFRTEAIAAARFSHPNSVAVIDYGETDAGTPFLVMEYVHGPTLSQLVRDESPFDAGRAIRLVTQILDALGAAHDLGIVHADVKSDNVLVESTRDRGEQAKLVDFGLARLSSDHDAFADAFISGTPDYMAPEVIGGAAPTPASDIYAVGAMLYELLTGATPFAGRTNLEIMRGHLDDVVVPPWLRSPEQPIPRHVESAVMRALEKDPGQRFVTAAGFIAALDAEVLVPAARPARRSVPPRPLVADAVTTLVWPAPSEPHDATRRDRIARGSAEIATAEFAARRDIGVAIQRGTTDEVADGYLALAALLRGADRPRAAVTELEEAVDVLGGGAGPAAGAAPIERVLMALVPLYVELGDHAAASRAACALDGRATLTMPRA